VKVAVVGAGAMGSVYAGLLAAAGNDVWAIDPAREHIEAIRERGLRVEGASGDRTVRLHATTDPAEAGTQDVVVLATKAMHVEAAAAGALPLVGPDTVVVTIQNGLGSAEKVARVLGPERVAVGVAGGFGASLVAPGHVHHNGWELIRIGERGRPATPRLERIAEVWRAAGFRAEACDDIDRIVWEKLVCNACFSGVCLVLERTIGEVADDPDAWKVASACAREADAVARAKRIPLSFDDPEAYVRAFGSRIRGARPSTLLDHLAGRRSEIGVINGAIPGAAREVGLDAPVNETITALVAAKERSLPA
jgi:2-dehydropantoate 2-reductase